VVITFAPRLVKLMVLDNGQGFDMEAVKQDRNGHLGLLGMQERAESLGGSLSIQTQLGQGTRVELVIPVI
jgi:signal transduction histidine kinase